MTAEVAAHPSTQIPLPQRHSGDTRVQKAFSLGWQIAQLYHYPVPLETLEPQPSAERLPGLSSLSDARRYALLARTIGAGFLSLAIPADPGAPPPSVTGTLQALNKDGHTAAEVRQAALDLHVALLEALNVADYRLGKAYGLGHALCETATLPMIMTQAGQTAQTQKVLDASGVLTITRWLAALKTDLPDHASYAVSRSVQTWRTQWPTLTNENPEAALTALVVQGRVWRVLLSGEKAAIDMLSAGDYIRAAEAMLGRAGRLTTQVIRHFWWAILAVLLTVTAVIVLISTTGAFTRSGKLTADLLTVLAGLGISVKSLTSVGGKIAIKLETPLWQSELDESVAVAAMRLPHGTQATRRHGDDVGKLRPAAEPTRNGPTPDPTSGATTGA
ncbi:MAG: hypothetical protein JWN47_3403 [Frankiales bacterium]|nr:hypothetical protein [Frankiales bacterium]